MDGWEFGLAMLTFGLGMLALAAIAQTRRFNAERHLQSKEKRLEEALAAIAVLQKKIEEDSKGRVIEAAAIQKQHDETIAKLQKRIAELEKWKRDYEQGSINRFNDGGPQGWMKS
jgi:uncharacterized protein involved in exopolysaccharide biosynthesis